MSDEKSPTIEISAKVGKDGVPKKATITVGEDIKAAIKLFGEEVVFSNFRANVIVSAQSALRSAMKGGKSDKEIAEEMANWKPGVRKAAKSAVDKLAEKASKMTDEEKATLRKLLAA